jgi:uncharacterized membrane protein
VIGHPVLLLFAGAALWTLATFVAPLLTSAISGALYAAGGVVCHQLPTRSFHLSSGPLAVCARCFGLYLGAVIGFGLAAAQRQRIGRFSRAPALIAICAAPTVATLAGEWLLAWPVGNPARFLAALPLGAAVAMTIGAAVADDYRQAAARTELVR